MNYYLGALVLVTYISSSAALPRCVCTRDMAPVCGTDGTTYNNECLLDCERTRGKPDLQVASLGRCEFPGIQQDPNSCICTLEHMPVCGSDGKTYPNGCAMDCAARARSVEIVKVHNGECRQKREITLPSYSCMCPLILKPVCGSDGRTYPNECAMDCEATGSKSEIVKVSDGECKKFLPECVCTFDYKPVCGSDGKTYSNRCSMDCHAAETKSGIFKLHDGQCRSKRDTVKVAQLDPCVCTKEKKPVCGTDGHTYSNPCILRCAKQARADLEIQYKGICENDESLAVDIPHKMACTCSRDYAPVCATNGETYPNECQMSCAGARLARDGRCDGVVEQVVLEESS